MTSCKYRDPLKILKFIIFGKRDVMVQHFIHWCSVEIWGFFQPAPLKSSFQVSSDPCWIYDTYQIRSLHAWLDGSGTSIDTTTWYKLSNQPHQQKKQSIPRNLCKKSSWWWVNQAILLKNINLVKLENISPQNRGENKKFLKRIPPESYPGHPTSHFIKTHTHTHMGAIGWTPLYNANTHVPGSKLLILRINSSHV